MKINKKHIFERSGLASVSDLNTEEWQQIYNVLDTDQKDFLSKKDYFLNSEYTLPHAPLYGWSRIWEYPYAYFHCMRGIKLNKKVATPTIADLGSGVTFFPFSIARLGFDVICIDINPEFNAYIKKANEVISSKPGLIEFRHADVKILPCTDQELDGVICISVLEHIPTFIETIEEMARVLKKGGFLILTIDLDLRGDSEIGYVKHKLIKETLFKYFDYVHPDVTIHPADMLDSYSGPYGFNKSSIRTHPWFYVKQDLIKPLLNKKVRYLEPYHLAVQAFSLIKK